MSKITKKNEVFEKLTKAQKRVQIAQDVIKSLNAGKLVAEQGIYVTRNRKTKALGKELFDENVTCGLDTILEKIPKCNVCALGGLFVEAVKRHDKITTDEISSDPWQHELHYYLKKFFSVEQLRMIEDAFESEGPSMYGNDKALTFCNTLKKPRDRMLKIMNNIVENNGTFRP